MCMDIKCSKCGNELLVANNANLKFIVCEKCWESKEIGNFNIVDKSDEQHSIIDVHTMAISSLPPDEFVELERILKMLAETRRIALPKW